MLCYVGAQMDTHQIPAQLSLWIFVPDRILALASYPTYDPNAWEKGLTVQQATGSF